MVRKTAIVSFGIVLFGMVGTCSGEEVPRTVEGRPVGSEPEGRGGVSTGEKEMIEARSATIGRMIQILEKGGKTHEEMGAQMSAARVLAAYRAEEAVDVLMRRLVDVNPGVIIDLWSSYPCAKALARIGTPAFEAIVEGIRGDESEERLQVYVAILRQEGVETAIVRVAIARTRVGDEKKANALDYMLEWLAGWRNPTVKESVSRTVGDVYELLK